MQANEIKLVITKTEYGITVYDDNIQDRIDLFPNTQEGYERFVDFIAKYMSQEVNSSLKIVK